jgi:hypothetical protein
VSVESPITPADHLFAGDAITLRYTVVDEAGAALDIASWEGVEFIVRPGPGITASITKELGDGITLTDAPNGVLDVEIDAADTASLRAGTYIYTLRHTSAGADRTIAFGDLFLWAQVGT